VNFNEQFLSGRVVTRTSQTDLSRMTLEEIKELQQRLQMLQMLKESNEQSENNRFNDLMSPFVIPEIIKNCDCIICSKKFVGYIYDDELCHNIICPGCYQEHFDAIFWVKESCRNDQNEFVKLIGEQINPRRAIFE
jgi:hypothetical protein